MSTNLSTVVYKNGEINSLIEKRAEMSKRSLDLDLQIINTESKCDHSLYLKCGDENSSMGIFYICPICGRRIYHRSGESFSPASIELDFTKNEYGDKMRNGEYVIATAIMQALRILVINKKNIILEEFVKMIPEEWYTNGNLFRSDDNPELFLPFTEYSDEKVEKQKVKVKIMPDYFVGYKKLKENEK